MHRHDPKLPDDQQDKRSVVPIDLADVDAWLRAPTDEAAALVRVAPAEVFEAGPMA
jgi:putative SOS response-associated peptidase YedK